MPAASKLDVALGAQYQQIQKATAKFQAQAAAQLSGTNPVIFETNGSLLSQPFTVFGHPGEMRLTPYIHDRTSKGDRMMGHDSSEQMLGKLSLVLLTGRKTESTLTTFYIDEDGTLGEKPDEDQRHWNLGGINDAGRMASAIVAAFMQHLRRHQEEA